ncbi:hypothetical protein [Sphingomonas kyungheensis]|uniref:Uncharacterized protein n=1 Tax=Sphingomonas kyungheensis TaxID=1069987 RepID=A0ABU8H693_9SPHN
MNRYVLPAKLEGRKTRVGAATLKKLDGALGAIVGEVVELASRGYAMKLSTRKESFTGLSVSRTSFEDVIGPLVAAQLVEHVPGYRDAAGVARAPLFMATPELVATVKGFGLADRISTVHFLKRHASKSNGEGSQDSSVASWLSS